MRKLILCLALFGASTSFAQATRTWLSGYGDDLNPCSRTAPCQTLQGALVKTAAGGEINFLDVAEGQSQDAAVPVVPDLGEVHITKAITIDARAVFGVVSEGAGSATSPGITIEAGPGDRVTLRNLAIVANQSGTSGIVFKSGKSLMLEHVTIDGFSVDGVTVQTTTPAFVSAGNSTFSNNGGAGISVNFYGTGQVQTVAMLSKSSFLRNGSGIGFGPGASATVYDCVLSGNSADGVRVSGNGAASEANIEGSTLSGNGIGVAMRSGTSGSTVRLSQTVLMSNTQRSVLNSNGTLHTFGTNRMLGAACVNLTGSGNSSLVAGQPYLFSNLELSNGLGTLHTMVLDGGLPPGISIDGGTIFGTPTLKGTFPTTYLLTDSFGCTSTNAATWTYNVNCPAQSLTPSAAPGGTTGTPYASTAFTLSGAVGTATTSITGALPIGMYVNGSSLTGTPGEPGTFPLLVSASDSATCGLAQTLSLVIAPVAGFRPSTVSLVATPNPVEFGAPFQLIATIDAGLPDAGGAVDWLSSDGGIFAISSVNANIATLPRQATAVGTVTYGATYEGNGVVGGSRAAPITLTVVPASTVLSLSAPSTALTTGDSITITALVTSDGGIPAGDVSFSVDNLPAGIVTLSNGSAAKTTVAALAGTHAITATYTGSTNFAASAVATLSITVTDPIVDSGTPDSGSTVDAGVEIDAGMMVADSGSPDDAGTVADGGSTMMVADGGGGEVDGGTDPNMNKGCGCQGTGSGLQSALLLMGALVVLRRRTS